MRTIMICIFGCCILLNACGSKSKVTSQDLDNSYTEKEEVTQAVSPTNLPTDIPVAIVDKDLAQEGLTSNKPEVDILKNNKGSKTNPYFGLYEYFQIASEIPDQGVKSQILLEFTHLTLNENEEKDGWCITGRVKLVSNSSANLPININDYISLEYYDENGVIGNAEYSLNYADISSVDPVQEDFQFTTDCHDGWITNSVSVEEFEDSQPTIAAIKFYFGEEYREIFFAKYENQTPCQYSNSTDVKEIIDRGSLDNPYRNYFEFFDITCQIPGEGKKSEIKLEFKSTSFHDFQIGEGCSIASNVELLEYNQELPININDYISFVYYDEDGIVGKPEYSVYYSDTDYEAPAKEEFQFITGRLVAPIYNSNQSEEFGNRVPKIAALKYYDGEEYKEIYFIKYANGGPVEFTPNK